MSQRNLKCTVCSGSHSGFIALIFAKAVVATTVGANVKRYDSLLKDHERLAQAFRNQEKETQLLGQQLEEKEKEYEEVANDAEELANLVRTKCEAIKTLEKRLVEAKKLIASLKQELQSARNSSSVTEPQHPDPPQQQSTCVSSHSLSSIHSRYDKVLQLQYGQCLSPIRLSPEHPTRFHRDSRAKKGGLEGI